MTIDSNTSGPNSAMISALNLAAMRGVEVDILIPEKNNLAYVGWAMDAGLWQILIRGCRVWATPPPFDHTKLLIIDSAWSLIGSSNLDPRSLRLNFELGVEVFEDELNRHLSDHFDEVIPQCRPLTADFIRNRSKAARLRDATSSLFSPYL